MKLERSKAVGVLLWLVKGECCSVQELRAGISDLNSVTGAGGKRGGEWSGRLIHRLYTLFT